MLAYIRGSALTLTVVLSACGGDDVSTCVPGMSIECACSDGRSGAQTCQADGTYSACLCEGSPVDSGPGLDGSSSVDGGGTTDAPSGSDGCVPTTEDCDGGDEDCDSRVDEGCSVGGITDIAAGTSAACAVRDDGTVLCWGARYGTTPVAVSGATSITRIAMEHDHVCATRTSGDVVCWGLDDNCQLGNGEPLEDSATPVSAGAFVDAVAVGAGQGHSCVIVADGTAYCWGWDRFGQIGDGHAEKPPFALRYFERFPEIVMNIVDAVDISLGSAHSCALLSSGGAACWGNNGGGELGAATTMTFSETPVLVTGLSDASQIDCSGPQCCITRSDGTAACWGSGLLGLNPVPGLSAIAEVAAGDLHRCARVTGGAVHCWGANGSGQIGDGTLDMRTAPVPVTGVTDAARLALGAEFSCALRSGGRISCWGNNNAGQLGNGTMINERLPVDVMLP